MDKKKIHNTAHRLYNLDTYEAKDNGETIESIAETIENKPLVIIDYLLDIIDELQS